MTKASDTAIEYLDQMLEMWKHKNKGEPFTDILLCELNIDAVKYAIAAINTGRAGGADRAISSCGARSHKSCRSIWRYNRRMD